MSREDGIDALAVAAILSIVVVAIVATIDLIYDGELSPSILALFVAITTPLVPALLVRYNRKGGDGDQK